LRPSETLNSLSIKLIFQARIFGSDPQRNQYTRDCTKHTYHGEADLGFKRVEIMVKGSVAFGLKDHQYPACTNKRRKDTPIKEKEQGERWIASVILWTL